MIPKALDLLPETVIAGLAKIPSPHASTILHAVAECGISEILQMQCNAVSEFLDIYRVRRDNPRLKSEDGSAQRVQDLVLLCNRMEEAPAGKLCCVMKITTISKSGSSVYCVFHSPDDPFVYGIYSLSYEAKQ